MLRTQAGGITLRRTKHITLSNTYDIIYDLSEYEELGFLPSAFVANCNEKGMMTYVAHKVHAQTITDYGLELTSERAELFRLIDNLQVFLGKGEII